MQLLKYRTPSGAPALGILAGEQIRPLKLPLATLTDLLEAADPAAAAEEAVDADASPLAVDSVTLLPPIDRQEVWAAGVTYTRSRTARMEESEHGATFYDRVYTADRPELFLKATPHRVVGPGQPVRIRLDSEWNVPEPELTLVISSKMKLVGFTVGNDMSSRDIEGENPLYLPQAKCYDGAAALGPAITLASAMPKREEIGIELKVDREGETIFAGTTDIGQMARTFEDLIEYLGRDNRFPDGVFLMTGTGIVPNDDFTLLPGDVVHISIDGIGTLSNPVIQG